MTDSSRRNNAGNSLTSGAVGVHNDGFIAAQKRAINAASTESVLDSFCLSALSTDCRYDRPLVGFID